MYFKLTDAEGHYEISIRYVQVDTGKKLAEIKEVYESYLDKDMKSLLNIQNVDGFSKLRLIVNQWVLYFFLWIYITFFLLIIYLHIFNKRKML